MDSSQLPTSIAEHLQSIMEDAVRPISPRWPQPDELIAWIEQQTDVIMTMGMQVLNPVIEDYLQQEEYDSDGDLPVHKMPRLDF